MQTFLHKFQNILWLFSWALRLTKPPQQIFMWLKKWIKGIAHKTRCRPDVQLASPSGCLNVGQHLCLCVSGFSGRGLKYMDGDMEHPSHLLYYFWWSWLLVARGGMGRFGLIDIKMWRPTQTHMHTQNKHTYTRLYIFMCMLETHWNARCTHRHTYTQTCTCTHTRSSSNVLMDWRPLHSSSLPTDISTNTNKA